MLYSCCCLVAKSCLTLYNPMDCSPLGTSLCIWGSPGVNTGMGRHFLLHNLSPFISHKVRGPVPCLVFLMLSFKPVCSLFSFTFIKRLFSSSPLSAIRVVSSAYLRLLRFLPEILIPACASSCPAFLTIYSAYKLNKQGDNIQPWCTLTQFGTSLLFYVQF